MTAPVEGARGVVVLPGVTRLEQLDLEDTLGAEVDFCAEDLDPDEHGEFLTAGAVVALSAMAIKALAVWLSKNRCHNAVVDEEVTVELPDGTRMTRRLRVSSTSASTLPDGVAAALEELARAPREE